MKLGQAWSIAGHVRRPIIADVRRSRATELSSRRARSSRSSSSSNITSESGMSSGAGIPWLVAMMVDFVVWGMRPKGIVDGQTAAWFTPLLVGQRITKTMRRLARELAAEADHGGTALPSPALDGASRDLASAQADIEPMPLAA